MRTFKWPSIYRVTCPMYHWHLHFHRFWFWSKKCASHFCRESTNKNNQFSKWKTWIFNAILDQALKGIVVNQNIFYFFLYLLVWVSAMQCNVECMIAWGRKMQAMYYWKSPPPWWAREGGAWPPSYWCWTSHGNKCGFSQFTLYKYI